jgi:hypothetical protein
MFLERPTERGIMIKNMARGAFGSQSSVGHGIFPASRQNAWKGTGRRSNVIENERYSDDLF